MKLTKTQILLLKVAAQSLADACELAESPDATADEMQSFIRKSFLNVKQAGLPLTATRPKK